MGIRDANRARQEMYYNARKRSINKISKYKTKEKNKMNHSSSSSTKSGAKNKSKNQKKNNGGGGGSNHKTDGEYNTAENISIFNQYEAIHINNTTQPYMSTTYTEIEVEENNNQKEMNEDSANSGSIGAFSSIALLLNKKKEKLLPMWWYPNVCLSLEFGKWSHTEEENIHRDLQHCSLSKYNGLERLLMAMTVEDQDMHSNEANNNGTTHGEHTSNEDAFNAGGMKEHQIRKKSDPLEIALDSLFPSHLTKNNSTNTVNINTDMNTNINSNSVVHRDNETTKEKVMQSDLREESQPIGNYNMLLEAFMHSSSGCEYGSEAAYHKMKKKKKKKTATTSNKNNSYFNEDAPEEEEIQDDGSISDSNALIKDIIKYVVRSITLQLSTTDTKERNTKTSQIVNGLLHASNTLPNNDTKKRKEMKNKDSNNNEENEEHAQEDSEEEENEFPDETENEFPDDVLLSMNNPSLSYVSLVRVIYSLLRCGTIESRKTTGTLKIEKLKN